MEDRIAARIEAVRDDLRNHHAMAALTSQRTLDVSERQFEIMEQTLELVRKAAPAFESMGKGANQLQNGHLQKLLIRVIVILVASQLLGDVIGKVGGDALAPLLKVLLTGM